jgi:hypothetical protein
VKGVVMKCYAVTWTVGETIKIEANSAEEAEDIVTNMTDKQLFDDMKNIMAGFEIICVDLC